MLKLQGIEKRLGGQAVLRGVNLQVGQGERVVVIDRLTEFSHVINMKECTTLRPKMASEP